MSGTSEMNPYQAPVIAASDGSESDAFSVFISATGLLCGLVATIGAVGRCLLELSEIDFSMQGVPTAPSSLFALCSLAFGIVLSTCIFGFVKKHVPKDQSTYCQCLLLIAILAMCARAILDPSSYWTPTWQTYALTGCGVLALGMVLRHARVVR